MPGCVHSSCSVYTMQPGRVTAVGVASLYDELEATRASVAADT